jgi:hypothetical protein
MLQKSNSSSNLSFIQFCFFSFHKVKEGCFITQVFSYFVAAEYCKKLKAERTQMQNEAEILRQEIESLNVQIRLVWQKHYIEERISQCSN